MVLMSFSMIATRELWKYLGEFDAISEMNEIAIRSLLHSYKRVGKVLGKDASLAFVSRASEKHGIRVNASVIDQLAVGMARNYVCTVWNSVDSFLKEFRAEHQKLTGSEWNGDSRDKSRIRLTFENLFGSEQKGAEAIGLHRNELLNYCRTVRNRIVHPRSTTSTAVEESYARLEPNISALQVEYGVSQAPRQFSEICFEDSILLSRVLKDVALVINNKATPAPGVLLGSIDHAKFKRINNPARRKAAIKGELCTRFGLDSKEAAAIVELGLLA